MVKTRKLGNALRRVQKVVWHQSPGVLLCPRIPEPLHGVNPRTILGASWWNQTRRDAYKSTLFHCLACGVAKYKIRKGPQWLEGHEIYSIDYLLGRMEYLETVPLCHYCHSYIHSGRLSALFDEGQITHATYAAIIQHGDRVLRKAGLAQPLPYVGPAAEWGDWRLVLKGKEYPPLKVLKVDGKKV